jgi:hypothetical protein
MPLPPAVTIATFSAMDWYRLQARGEQSFLAVGAEKSARFEEFCVVERVAVSDLSDLPPLLSKSL